MNRRARYLITTVASCAASASSLAAGLIVGSYATQHGVPTGLVAAVTISMRGMVIVPAYITKKLLIDYW